MCTLPSTSTPVLQSVSCLQAVSWSCTSDDPLQAVLTLLACCAVLQYGTALAWFASQNGGSICFDLGRVAIWQWALFAGLLGYGQLLNLSVYNKLGKNGVYYGCKLGHTIPWVTGFPFDSVPHPQYIGSAMTSVAVAALFSTAAPAAWPVAAYWCSLYAFSGFVEQNL